MPFIIAEPCVGTCDTACVEVCPVDCIHGPYDKEGMGQEAKEDGFIPKETDSLYIDPEECIDCGACEPECPVEAIFEESEVPDEWNKYIKINYQFIYLYSLRCINCLLKNCDSSRIFFFNLTKSIKLDLDLYKS